MNEPIHQSAMNFGPRSAVALGINIEDSSEMDTVPVQTNSDPPSSSNIRVQPTVSQDLSRLLPTDIQGTGNPVVLNDNDGFTTVVNNRHARSANAYVGSEIMN